MGSKAFQNRSLFWQFLLTVVVSLVLELNSSYAQTRIDQPEILKYYTRGSGCPSKGISVTLSPDSQDISILYGNYTLEIGTGSIHPKILRATKSCHIILDIFVPANKKFALRTYDVRGFISLPDSAEGFEAFGFHYVRPLGEQWKLYRESRKLGRWPIHGHFVQRTNYQGPIDQDISTSVTFDNPIESNPPNQNSWDNKTLCRTKGFTQRLVLTSKAHIDYIPKSTNRTIAQVVIDSTDFSTRNNVGLAWADCQ